MMGFIFCFNLKFKFAGVTKKLCYTLKVYFKLYITCINFGECIMTNFRAIKV